VIGDRLSPAAALFVDGVQMPFIEGDGQLVVKPIALQPGQHIIRVVNPGDVASTPFVLILE
jgi:hypothetical protein